MNVEQRFASLLAQVTHGETQEIRAGAVALHLSAAGVQIGWPTAPETALWETLTLTIYADDDGQVRSRWRYPPVGLELRGARERLRWKSSPRGKARTLSEGLQAFAGGGVPLPWPQALALMAMAKAGGARIEFLAAPHSSAEGLRQVAYGAWVLTVFGLAASVAGSIGILLTWDEATSANDHWLWQAITLLGPVWLWELWLSLKAQQPDRRVIKTWSMKLPQHLGGGILEVPLRRAALWSLLRWLVLAVALLGLLINAIVMVGISIDDKGYAGPARDALAWLLCCCWLGHLLLAQGLRGNVRCHLGEGTLSLWGRWGRPWRLPWTERTRIEAFLVTPVGGVFLSKRSRRRIVHAMNLASAGGAAPLLPRLRASDPSTWPLAPRPSSGTGLRGIDVLRILILFGLALIPLTRVFDRGYAVGALAATTLCLGFAVLFWVRYVMTYEPRHPRRR